MEETQQSKKWSGDFGKEYTDRNPQSVEEFDQLYTTQFGVTRTQLNKEFLETISKNSTILEVGSNIGIQLQNLQKLGFVNLTGVEILNYALEKAKIKSPNINFLKASALDLPFKDNLFDIVFTSGVLIHIHPNELNKAIDEIYRTSKKYIWCFEYFSENCKEIEYRGNQNLLWKNNFMRLFLEKYPDLQIVKEKKIKYLSNDDVDHMFLLKK